MQAAVKTHRTEIIINGEISKKLLDLLRDEYGEALHVIDGEEMLDVFETDWYPSVKAGILPGDVLRHYRRMHRLTQAELGRRIGNVPRQPISNMERGHREISLTMARRLGQVFDLPPARFLSL